MASARTLSVLSISLLLLLSSPSPSHSFFSNYRTVVSLSHSLFSRVANIRDARGDRDGASRARGIASGIDRVRGFGFYKFAWNVGWDYARNFRWRETVSFETLGGLVSDVNELLRVLGDLSRLRSDAERAAWVGRNYKYALRISKSLFDRLLVVLRQSGPLQDAVETLRREFVDGDLLRDCLELGSEDLKGLVEVLKDIVLQYYPASPKTDL